MTDSRKRDLCERAFILAADVFRLYPKLAAASARHALIARQLLSATASMGSLLEEGQAASSRRDMAAKYSIALREAREAKFWARLAATDPRWAPLLAPIIAEAAEFVAMLTAAVKKLRLPPAAVVVGALVFAFALLTYDFLLLT